MSSLLFRENIKSLSGVDSAWHQRGLQAILLPVLAPEAGHIDIC